MIYIDDIVFTQKQLDEAVGKGHRNICLCDNSFLLPPADGISYMGIGNVSAVVRLDRERRYNISFEGFKPTIIYTGGYTGITENTGITEETAPLIYGSYGSYGSYTVSYTSGGGSGSGAGKIRSSYFTSGSATTSALTSFATSYGSGGSARYLMSALYTPVCEQCGPEEKTVSRPVFYAAGYGLDLI